MDADRLLTGLNAAQERAVTTSVVPLCILAGAGSGKTRVLTRRIAYRAATDQHDPRRVLALTFTRKAAGELTQRLRQLGLRDSVVAGTFHAVAYAQLRARWEERNVTPPTLLDRKAGFVARLMPAGTPGAAVATRARGTKRSRGTRDVAVLDIVTEIEWAKARRVTPESYVAAAKAARRDAPLDPGTVASIFDRYEAEKRSRRMVDFDDLLSLCLRDLLADPDFAAAQHWRFRHFYVDEYQDVNPLQQALLRSWLGDSTDLCVVGDPNQAIYAWNGADASYLNEFSTTWQRGEVVRLAENYRSSPQVVAVANAVLAGSLGASRRAARGADIGLLQANRPDGSIPTVRTYADDRAEAHGIARAIRDQHRPGTSWSGHAILVRTNAQTTVLEHALRGAQIPFRVRGGTSLLEQPEVKAALRDLRDWRVPFTTALADLASEAAAGDDEADSRRANIDALVRLGHDYANLDPRASTNGFLSWLKETSRTDQPDARGDAVEICTFHAAKGLEWPVVHLAGLEQGLVPIGHAQTPAELAEERRLFYVAVTRAEHTLCCSWAQHRTFGTRTVARDRSPYLAQVDAAREALAADQVPDDWAGYFRDSAAGSGQGSLDLNSGRTPRSASGRATVKRGRVGGALSTVDPADLPLLDALKEWRAGVARAASISAFVVFHDNTLEAIAARHPATIDELLEVNGVGPVKASRYGKAILAVVAGH